MATHATTLTRCTESGGESLTIVPVSEKSRHIMKEHMSLPPHVTFKAKHYVGAKLQGTENLTTVNLERAKAVATLKFGWELN